ncbi:hypothetical protein GQX73_g5532 [Xylaria multiplex]|uniref:Uncharacterized protein n=1 Tax=Xylaria multiplex TaxID=323545 RepID=A0A7C8MS08_9PEZI|nr:hypothetical protein GQX73_g5532 [Xylaria multiplex]
MYIALNDSLLYRRSQGTVEFLHVKRYTDEAPGGFLPIIIIPIVFVSVFVPLLVLIFRSWKLEKANALKKQQSEAKEERNENFGKAELPNDSSVIINEMDASLDALELPENKEGLSHELPGSVTLAQELPAAIHEMPAEGFNSGNKETNQPTRLE